MARRSRREIIRQIESLEPAIIDAFLESVDDITNGADIGRITGFLIAGDIESAISAIGIEEAAFREVDLAITAAFISGGKSEIDDLPRIRRPDGARAIFRFDVRNERAERWLRQNSAGLVTRIVQSQRDNIRSALISGLSDGRNPRNAALDMIGRINRATGRREGGIVGLTNQQSDFVRNARSQLRSGEPSVMREYFNRAKRDRRFDPIVRQAIEQGRAVSHADVDRIVGRYADRLLKLRGETIARTESLNAFNAASDEALQQVVESGIVPESAVSGVWDSAGDSRTRDAHLSMDGQKKRIGDPFISPSGALLMHPGDTSLGAPAEEVVHCRCIKRRQIDFISIAS